MASIPIDSYVAVNAEASFSTFKPLYKMIPFLLAIKQCPTVSV
jgi:hypothetical protein